MKQILIASFFGFLIFLTGCGALEPITPTLMLSAEPPSYDFGDIPQQGGKVSTVFLLKNSGAELITINRVSTSCGCTTAEMDQSPMSAGEERKLTVTFDPLTHPDESGLIQRAVYIQNSDSNFPELILDITGNVVASVESGQ
ncbi:DUF1573 domain-containing protein [Candidatus Peregrinibacteria bacterium]|nr:DUF1573 domain-containing protein [Candidatus Peregrinibacteria bacterium]